MNEHEDEARSAERAFEALCAATLRVEQQIGALAPLVRTTGEQVGRLRVPDYAPSLGELMRAVRALGEQVMVSLAARPVEPVRLPGEPGTLEHRLAGIERDLGRVVAAVDAPVPRADWRPWAGAVLIMALAGALLAGLTLRLVPDSLGWGRGAATWLLAAGTPERAAEVLLGGGDPDAALARARGALLEARHGAALQHCQDAAARTGRAVSCTLEVPPPR